MVEEQKLLEKEVFSSRTNKLLLDTERCAELKYDPKENNPYTVEVDYNDLKIAEEKYKRREIEKVTINNRDFYISYEQIATLKAQRTDVYVWPCAWGWSGKIDGYRFQMFKGNILYLLQIILEHCDDLYEFTDNVIYRIKNQPANEIPTTPLITKDLLAKPVSSLLTAGTCPICLGQGYVPNLSVTSGIECCNKCFGSGVCI